MYSCSCCSLARHTCGSCYKPSSINVQPRYEASSTMASQIPADNPVCYEVPSFVRGYHAYQLGCVESECWPSFEAEKGARQFSQSPCCCCREVRRYCCRTRSIQPGTFILPFLGKRVYITGERTNRGTGNGLKVPCIYRLYDPKAFVDR